MTKLCPTLVETLTSAVPSLPDQITLYTIVDVRSLEAYTRLPQFVNGKKIMGCFPNKTPALLSYANQTAGGTLQ